jgi:predicted nucleotidyltransferase
LISKMVAYPGSTRHQALLGAIITHYEADPRILAIVVFGSLGRGTWDATSDIDLDVTIADDAVINVVQELGQLCESFSVLQEKAAVIIPDGDDAGDVVLESLMQLSIRYHALAQTHPNIVQSMQVLAGRLSQAAIVAAGEANRRPVEPPTSQLLDACVRYAVGAQVYLQRRRIWLTVKILHRMRGILMQVFARTHRGERAYQTFESEADMALQARLGATLPQYDLSSLRHSLEALLDIMQNDLEYLAQGQIRLTSAHEAILDQIRKKLAA